MFVQIPRQFGLAALQQTTSHDSPWYSQRAVFALRVVLNSFTACFSRFHSLTPKMARSLIEQLSYYREGNKSDEPSGYALNCHRTLGRWQSCFSSYSPCGFFARNSVKMGARCKSQGHIWLQNVNHSHKSSSNAALKIAL